MKIRIVKNRGNTGIKERVIKK